jgi:hypothetical protein
MTETISLDTACALKAAGYPQPELQIGQFWYVNIGLEKILCVVVASMYDKRLLFRSVNGETFLHNDALERFYAPGAAELLKLMGTKVKVSYVVGRFVVFYFDGSTLFRHDSSAEALAQAWLYIKQRRGRI